MARSACDVRASAVGFEVPALPGAPKFSVAGRMTLRRGLDPRDEFGGQTRISVRGFGNARSLGRKFESDPSMVPGGGIEPPRCCHRRILSPLRLPVPSSRRRMPPRVARARRNRHYRQNHDAPLERVASLAGKVDDERRPQRAVHHVRPAAARPPVVLRRARAHAAHRRARGARRRLRPRVRAVRGLRTVADVVLYGPLRGVARRDVEPRAAVGRGTHARRLPARDGAQRRAGREDARDARRRRPRAVRHRAGVAARRAAARRRLRRGRSLRRPPAARTRVAATRTGCARAGMRARTRGTST